MKVVIYTHSLGGITDNDFLLAAALDQRARAEYSPKFLREHPEFRQGVETTEGSSGSGKGSEGGAAISS